MGVDLHTHSTFSDGTTTPEENVALARAAGLEGFALTDHDTLDGLDRAAAASRAAGLEFVPGVELSAEWRRGGEIVSVHVLGYWPDPSDSALVAECARLRGEREDRARAMVERLAALGAPVPWARVQALAGQAPIGRPHIAAALVEAGHVESVDEAFTAYIGEHRPAYVAKHALPPVEAVRLVRAAGGVVVLAHPELTFPAAVGAEGRGVTDPAVRALFEELVAEGLAGVECDHPAQTPAAIAAWRRITADHGLVATGCSDFHGENKAVRIGSCTTEPTVVHTLRAQASAASRSEESQPW